MALAPTPICARTALAKDQARTFVIEHNGTRLDIIVWQQADNIKAFINACPHMGTPLESFPDKLLDKNRQHLICSTHGARFNKDGKCISGPCVGASLTPLALTINEADKIMLATKPNP